MRAYAYAYTPDKSDLFVADSHFAHRFFGLHGDGFHQALMFLAINRSTETLANVLDIKIDKAQSKFLIHMLIDSEFEIKV